MAWKKIDEILLRLISRPKIKKDFCENELKKILKKKWEIDDFILKSGGRAEIRIESSVLRQEAYYKKEEIKNEINKYLFSFGNRTVRELLIKKN